MILRNDIHEKKFLLANSIPNIYIKEKNLGALCRCILYKVTYSAFFMHGTVSICCVIKEIVYFVTVFLLKCCIVSLSETNYLESEFVSQNVNILSQCDLHIFKSNGKSFSLKVLVCICMSCCLP